MYAKYAKLRDERGLTDNKVAAMTGITFSTIYDWKYRANKDPNAKLSIDNAMKIARLFNVPVEALLEKDHELNATM